MSRESTREEGGAHLQMTRNRKLMPAPRSAHPPAGHRSEGRRKRTRSDAVAFSATTGPGCLQPGSYL